MDVLKRALESKKAEVSKAHDVTGPKKYLKRKELQQLEDKVAAEEQAQNSHKKTRPGDSDASALVSNDVDMSDARTDGSAPDTSQRNGDTEASSSLLEALTHIPDSIDIDEIKRRLRAIGQPITLFGETAKDRLLRLRSLELDFQERAAAASGQKNSMRDILEREVAEELERATERQIEQERGGGASANGSADADAKERKAKASKYDMLRPRASFESPEAFVLHFFKHLLNEWEKDLHARPDAVKRTTHGKLDSAMQKQTRHNMRPFFRILKEKTCEADLLIGVEKLALACLDRDYIKASEHYLMLAIGNAAWPIGVTMVGIHERSGREKIFSQHVAHVLNDETTRKYIQAIKRLMTYAQEKYPTNPARRMG